VVQYKQVGAGITTEHVISDALHLFTTIALVNVVLGVTKVQIVIKVDTLREGGDGVTTLHFKFSLVDVGQENIHYLVLQLARLLITTHREYHNRSNQLHVIERLKLIIYEGKLIF
jgi:hypothetical protein